MRKSFTLFGIFFKTTALTVGGGFAMIPVFEDELVENYKFISEEKFYELVGKIQVLPGVIAINTALICGYEIDGWKGALFAALGSIIPPFFIILLAAYFINYFKDNIYIESFFSGARVAAAVILVDLVFKLIKKRKIENILVILIFVMFGIFYWLKLYAVFILLISVVFFTLIQFLFIKLKILKPKEENSSRSDNK